MANLMWIPLLVAVLALFIEYWLIQPIRKSSEASGGSLAKREDTDASEGSYVRSRLVRILSALTRHNFNRPSVGIIKIIGNILVAPPSFLLSVISVVIAIPTFAILIITEKLGGCRFMPTCKDYLVVAIEVHGPIKGLLLGLRRVMRCNPFTHGGKDTVPVSGRVRKRRSTEVNSKVLAVGAAYSLQAITIILLINFVLPLALILKYEDAMVRTLVAHLPFVLFLAIFAVPAMLWSLCFVLYRIVDASWVGNLVLLATAGLIWFVLR